MDIRLEKPEEYRQVENLVREAFWNVYQPGCVEHYLVHIMREHEDFIPALDFVLEEDGRIIGNIMSVSYTHLDVYKRQWRQSPQAYLARTVP